MKTFKDKTIKVLDSVYCDCCGCSTITINMGPSWATLCATWGYGCILDGVEYDIHLCQNCFIEVLDFIKQKRKKILGAFKYPHDKDPLEGEYIL